MRQPVAASGVRTASRGERPRIRIGRRTVRGLAPAYESVPHGGWLAIEGSSGLIEISRREASAAAALRAGVGARVQVTC